MAINNIEVLDPGEASLAKVLVRNNLVPAQAVNDFITLKKRLLVAGKPFLGEVLIAMSFITQADLDQFVADNEKDHAEFINSLCQKGFLTKEQHQVIVATHEKTGKNMASIVADHQIMTKENYNKQFSNSAMALKLGEWLVVIGRVTQERLDKALEFRNVATFDSYLVNRLNFKKEVLRKIKNKIGAE